MVELLDGIGHLYSVEHITAPETYKNKHSNERNVSKVVIYIIDEVHERLVAIRCHLNKFECLFMYSRPSLHHLA
jgi:hypothetical protein